MDQQHLVETALMACEFEHLLGEVGHLLEVGHRHQGDHHQEVQVGPGLEGDWDPWMLQVAERQRACFPFLVAGELSAVGGGALSSLPLTMGLEAIDAHQLGTRPSTCDIGV